ncbi:hypothetical protein CMI41_01915 [Candidatus Pacearchaeota archaeon]|nr:hypothetical protein [Candidatus Pacearchaeota archaeon]|tara:strand:- start:6733 stop:7257 length:525 start_codon:yes stop_codon:yes gene_type:complete
MKHIFQENSPIELHDVAMNQKKGCGYSDEYLIPRNPMLHSIEWDFDESEIIWFTLGCGYAFGYTSDLSELEHAEEVTYYNPCNFDEVISSWDDQLRTHYIHINEYIHAFIKRENKENSFNLFIYNDNLYSLARIYYDDQQKEELGLDQSSLDRFTRMELTPDHSFYKLLLDPQL